MKHVLFVAVALLALCGVAVAEGECPSVKAAADTAKAAADTPQMALFRVPGLTDELAKGIIKALAEEAGILAAKPSVKDTLLAVTFDGKKTTAEKVQKVVTTVVTDATLVKLGAAPPMAHGPCGGCPSRKSCASAKE